MSNGWALHESFTFYNGAKLTYDGTVNAGYLHVSDSDVARTVTIPGVPETMVDVDKHGRIVGIETFGRVDVNILANVLRHLKTEVVS